MCFSCKHRWTCAQGVRVTECWASTQDKVKDLLLPAVIMALKQDFWSMRGQIMYRALGLR